MSYSKHFDKIALCITAIALVITLLFMNGSALGIEILSRNMGYEDRLFDNTRVHTIDIVTDDWDSFIASAQSEEYSACNVIIDGEVFKNVGIRGKGNTSLSSVAAMGSERYSFKIEFDQYDSTQNYYGLDKLSLNNLIQDNTMMKDYLTYTMMNEFGVDSPLCSYVYITVNGEDWGLYLAVEAVEESFMQRNYGSNYGELYKPDSTQMGGGRGNGRDFDFEAFTETGEDNASVNSAVQNGDQQTGQTMPDTGGGSEMQGGQMMPGASGEMQMPEGFEPGSFEENAPDMNSTPSLPDGTMPDMNGNTAQQNEFAPAQQGGMGDKNMGGGMDMGPSDTKLQYTDDDPDSYSSIFDNAKTDITDADKARLIDSLEQLSANENIEDVVDIEQVIKYFVVHNYVVNGDSYTGSMIHNYYLYEKDGVLSMIPWDYNLAFGTFQGNDATSAVNDDIDSPLSVTGNDRPMIDWIFNSEEYTELYHQYFAEFLETVDIESIVNQAYELIAPYVEKDPTKFCTYEEFKSGVDTLLTFCALRSQSVAAQLAGEEANIDASSVNLSDMGTMNSTMNMQSPGAGDISPQDDMQLPEDMELPEGMETMPQGNMQQPENMELPEGAESMPQGNMQQPGGMGAMPQGNMQMQQ